jgi:hypothetical protein
MLADSQEKVAGGGRSRKVTYSLPAELADELDRRTAGATRAKSALVAEALTLCFAAKDRQALAAIYTEAAQDPLFQADNEAVLRDFAGLDPDCRWPCVTSCGR